MNTKQLSFDHRIYLPKRDTFYYRFSEKVNQLWMYVLYCLKGRRKWTTFGSIFVFVLQEGFTCRLKPLQLVHSEYSRRQSGSTFRLVILQVVKNCMQKQLRSRGKVKHALNKSAQITVWGNPKANFEWNKPKREDVKETATHWCRFNNWLKDTMV